MTDDVIEGKIEESQFRRAVVWLVGSRLAGTLIAQFLLVPSAVEIVGGGEGVVNIKKTSKKYKFKMGYQ
jgi:hypothetical protein